MPEKRTIKRSIIIFIYLAIPLAIGVFFYAIFSEEETCLDGKQNQNESGIDCGGVCSACFSRTQDLSVKKTEFVFGGEGIYDGLIEISNPNGNAGSPSFSYKADLKDEAGNIIDSKTGSSFILPAEDKYLPLLGFSVDSTQRPAKLDFQITNTEWKALNNYQKPALSVSNKRFNANGPSGTEAYGILKNESPLDFDTINVIVVLRDGRGNLLGLNMKQLNTVRYNEERDFPLNWPYQLPGEVSNMEVRVETNIYDKDNVLDVGL